MIDEEILLKIVAISSFNQTSQYNTMYFMYMYNKRFDSDKQNKTKLNE